MNIIISKITGFHILIIFLLLFSSLPVSSIEDAPKLVRIGVLANRGTDQCMEMWKPTANYLTQEVNGYSFTVIPFRFNEIYQAVDKGMVDLLLTNPTIYAGLEMNYGASPIVTLKNMTPKGICMCYGGVIIFKAGREDIQSLRSLKGKSFVGAHEDSLGGWYSIWRELKEKDINPYKDFKSLTFEDSHDAVVFAVRDGRADVGGLRTGILEELTAQGKIRMEEFDILHEHGGTEKELSFVHSTRRYPEWAMAKLPHIPHQLGEKIAIALLKMPPENRAALAAKCAGWTIPQNYQSVHDCLKFLRVGPYKDYGKVTVKDIFEHYWHWFLAAYLFITAVSLFAVYTAYLNRKLKTSITQRRHSENLLFKTNRALMVLSQSNRALMYADQEQELLETICKIIVETGKYRMARVGFAEQDKNKTVRNVAYAGFYEGYLSNLSVTWADTIYGRGPSGIAIRSGKTYIARNILTDVNFEPWRKAAIERGYASTIALPLFEYSRVFGVLNIYSEEPDAFSTDEAQLLTDLSNNLAYGILALRTKAERERVERERKRLFAAIVQSAEAVIITDTHGTIQYVNPAFERITGYSGDDAIGQNPRFLNSGKQDENFYHELWRTITSGQVWRGRLTNRKKTGMLYESQTTISPVIDDSGTIINYVSVSRDITQEVQLESQLRQAQKLEAIGTLAGGIAHDFNNILFPIFGYAQMSLELAPEGGVVRRNLEKLLIAARRAKELVHQILTFSRKNEQTLQPMQIQPIIKEALKLLRATLPKTITIQQKIDKSCGSVMADSIQIHQILMNLCTNAYQAMREKGGLLEVHLTEVEVGASDLPSTRALSPGIFLKLSISDQGHGIDPVITDKIFDPFFTTKAPGEGTGMGLFVVHGIVKSYGGFITVDSKLGKGSTFNIYLPRINKAATAENTLPDTDVPKGNNEQILIVDDEEPIVTMLQQMLEMLGYQVTGQTNSVDALEIFSEYPDRFDLVITDQTMPNMTGDQFAQKLLNIRPDIPIILCSGFSDLITKEQAKSIGVREYVMKPVVTGEVARAIHMALQEN